MQKLEVGQRITALDLAEGLEGNEGTFVAQQGGRSYLAVAKAGHSITSLRPIGRQFVEVVPVTVAQEPWLIEKISNQEMSFEAAAGRR